jgi:hypothetical protein
VTFEVSLLGEGEGYSCYCCFTVYRMLALAILTYPWEGTVSLTRGQPPVPFGKPCVELCIHLVHTHRGWDESEGL